MKFSNLITLLAAGISCVAFCVNLSTGGNSSIIYKIYNCEKNDDWTEVKEARTYQINKIVAPVGNIPIEIPEESYNPYNLIEFVESNENSNDDSNEISNEHLDYIGKYWITGYDNCYQCCGKTDGITKSGTIAAVDRTIASSEFEFGTKIYIDGLGTYIVEDRCPREGVIDVFCNNHDECYALTGQRDCYIIR